MKDQSDILKKKNLICDAMGLFFILLITFAYSLYGADFAELNIQLSFLNFPIFVGEILMFLCLVIFIYKVTKNKIQLNRWHWLIIGYFIWVIVKAMVGYCFWGPLSFRNAALFYYPIFSIFGFYFYNEYFFKQFYLIGL